MQPPAASPDLSATTPAVPASPSGAYEAPSAPTSLPVQIVERFVASLSGPDGVSPATAAALGSLLSHQASPSRDAILRSVQEAISAASDPIASAPPTETAAGSAP